jgi:hypothetical protein
MQTVLAFDQFPFLAFLSLKWLFGLGFMERKECLENTNMSYVAKKQALLRCLDVDPAKVETKSPAQRHFSVLIP